MTHVTLPHLRWFDFGGVSPYLEALLSRIRAPVLKKLQIWYFNQLTFSAPRLLQFLHTSENIVFDAVQLYFQEHVISWMVDRRWKWGVVSPLYMMITCQHLD
jgi:hypothetical protein